MCMVILEEVDGWRSQGPSGQGSAFVQTPSRPGSRRQDIPRAGTLAQILRKPWDVPQMVSQTFSTGEDCTEKGPGRGPLQKPPGDKAAPSGEGVTAARLASCRGAW